MQHRGEVITSLDALIKFIDKIPPGALIAADVETYKQRPTSPKALLLGLSLTVDKSGEEPFSAYVVINQYNKELKRFDNYSDPLYKVFIGGLFQIHTLLGWNVPFDKAWLDYWFERDTKWQADGRILWHLQNNDPAIRGFGLKLAQKKLLGWDESNDKELEEHVKLAGGKLSNGDHYLADLDMLSRYAIIDTYSTLRCYQALSPFMNQHKYWDFADEILNYAILIHKAANQGLGVDINKLERAGRLYEEKREDAKQSIRDVCKNEIKAIEEGWKVKKASTYKTDKGRTDYLAMVNRHRMFNPSSGLQRAMLLHTMLEFPVRERTPTGLAKTDRPNISLVPHSAATVLLNYSEYKKISEQAHTYLKFVEDSKLYTNYDVCGTVSGRLSGFKPSVLNMPFSESEVMSAFIPSDDYVFISADLAAIEPCVLAHYSDDPTLLKVYKDGLGDVYLDLGLDIFPSNDDLKRDYNPNEPIKKEIKETFKDLRAVCKIIHLAVSYTGTYITVSKNLTKAGYPTSKGEAMHLVKRYWQKFNQVKTFNNKLQEVYNNAGLIRNLVGRIIQVPNIYMKDLMNRLVQSSAHDILRLWVTRIITTFDARGVNYKFSLIDLHDSTTFQVRRGQEELARQCYLDALKYIEDELRLSVPLKCELKFCETLAGLKGE